MTTWPSTLPIRKDGYKESPPKRQLRSNMDVGPDKIRRRTSMKIRNVSVQGFWTDEQVEIFDQFYLDNDDSFFDFIHPRTGQTVTARFLDEEPSYDPNETMWDVSFKMETF